MYTTHRYISVINDSQKSMRRWREAGFDGRAREREDAERTRKTGGLRFRDDARNFHLGGLKTES